MRYLRIFTKTTIPPGFYGQGFKICKEAIFQNNAAKNTSDSSEKLVTSDCVWKNYFDIVFTSGHLLERGL